MGLGFAAFGAELPELEARCHERLTCAQPTALAATEDPQGTRVLNLFARDWLVLLCARAPKPLAAADARPTPAQAELQRYTVAKQGVGSNAGRC